MPKIKILMANPYPDQSSMIRLSLENAGYAVLPATRGREALDFLHTHRPDLLIVEKKLPDLNGLALIRLIRNESGYRELPIILTGVDARQDEIITGLEAGADVCLETPFHQGILVARVRALLRDYQPADSLPFAPDHQERE